MADGGGGAKFAETIGSEEESRKRGLESGDLSDTEEPKRKKSSVDAVDEPAYGLSCLHWNEEDDEDINGQGLLPEPRNLWPARSTLGVYFTNEVPDKVVFDGDKVNRANIIAWMNEWSPGDSPVPKFKRVNSITESKIRVEFTGLSNTKLGTDAMKHKRQPTMQLHLTSQVAKDHDKYVKYTVLHETGHALGFYHEHQHPDKDFFHEDVVIKYLATICNKGLDDAKKFYNNNFAKIQGYPAFPYDSNSVMTYRAKVSWIKDSEYCTGHEKHNGFYWPQSAIRGELSDEDKKHARMIYEGGFKSDASISRLSADSVIVGQSQNNIALHSPSTTTSEPVRKKRSAGNSLEFPPSTGTEKTSCVSNIPLSHHCYLDKIIDFDTNGVDADLSKISKEMLEWKENLAEHLQLTRTEIYDIEGTNPQNPILQRKKALQIWKNKQGFKATYRNLLTAFENAGNHQAAEAVCTAVKNKDPVGLTYKHEDRSRKRRRVSPDTPGEQVTKKHSAELVMSDLNEIKRLLKNLCDDDVIDLGLALGLEYPRLKNMTNKLNDVIYNWLKREDNVNLKAPPTWTNLVKALRDCNMNGIARDVEKEKC